MTKPKSFLKAVKWAYVGNWGERGFTALFTVVLAGLLGPRDFGTVSIALIYIGFLQMFLDQGFPTALIQRKELEAEHLDAVFWLDQVLSLFLVAISILLSGWWAAKNHAPEVATVISVMSICIPLQALKVVQVAILSREMDFRSLSIRSNAAVLAGGAVGLGMAFTGFGVWSLVWQQIVRDSTALALLWKLSSWRPRFKFSWKHLQSLTRFSLSNFVAQLALFAEGQTASIILGLLFGPIAVGLYRVADRICNSVVTIATSSIQSVSLPEFGRFQDKPLELRQSVLRCVHLCSVGTLPALAGLAAVSGTLMAALGPQWTPAAGVLKILSVLGMFFIFAFFTGPLLQALAMPRQLALLEWARVGAGVVILVIAGLIVRNHSISSQLLGIALARFVTVTFLITPVFVIILMRLSKVSFAELVELVAPAAIASASVVISVTLFHLTGWLSSGRPIFLLVAEALIGAVTGLTVLFWLDVQLRMWAAQLLERILGYKLVSKELV